MVYLYNKSHFLYQKLLSDNAKGGSERVVLIIAIISFLTHLAIIFMANLGLFGLNPKSELLKTPIAAIYTPFSFILIYEVYLLAHYLPKSITVYISKQYEIITLIIIRRLFKDLSSLSLSAEWFQIKNDLQFTYDIAASLILFFVIFLFTKESRKRYRTKEKDSYQLEGIVQFIKLKKTLATVLVLVIIFISVYSFQRWIFGIFDPVADKSVSFKNINNIFFEQFFTVLIVVDVILLLFSFFHTDEFHKVIRNSGFIISTILIRISFSVDGLLNTILIVGATVFGLLILILHNKYEAYIASELKLEESENLKRPF